MIGIFTTSGILTVNAQANFLGKYFFAQKSGNYRISSATFKLTGFSGGAARNNYDYWGAIAYSFSNGTDGTSWDYSTEREAATGAMRSCGRFDCRVLITVESECGAVAVSGGNGWGGGYGYSHSEARNSALNTCRKYGNRECRVAASVCTTTED